MRAFSIQKIIIFVLVALCSPLIVMSNQPGSNVSAEEALHVRRIMEFWKDKDYALASTQIQKFITQYPRSDFIDSLLVILGDIYWSQEKYQDALKTYDRIQKPAMREKSLVNRLDSFYHLNNYDAILQEAKKYVPSNGDLPKEHNQRLAVYYYAQALFENSKNENNKESAQRDFALAEQLLEGFIDTELAKNAQVALAEIYFISGKHQKSAEQYEKLAGLFPENAEQMLFLAARSQAVHDPDLAIETYQKISSIGGPRSSDANLQRLVLLFEKGRYKEIIKEENTFLNTVPPSESMIVALLVGRSHFNLKQYEKTISTLKPIYEKAKENHKYKNTPLQSILMTIILSAHHLNELALVEPLADEYSRIFSTDPSLPKVQFVLAMTYKNCDRFNEAENQLVQLLENHPQFDRMDQVLFELGVLQFKQKQWQESRKSLIALLQKYPNHPNAIKAWQQIPIASLHLVEDAEKRKIPPEQYQEQLISDLKMAMNVPGVLSEKQKPAYRLKIGKTLYDMGKFPEAEIVLGDFIDQYSSDPHLYQAHLLLAMTYSKGLNDTDKFIPHAEKALDLKPDLADRGTLLINLFTIYLQLAKNAEDQAEKNQYLEKAADRLYTVFKDQQEELSKESYIWLASYFYNQARKDHNELVVSIVNKKQVDLAKKALAVYEKFLDFQAVNLDDDNIALELDYYKSSCLYGCLNNTSKQIDILKKLSKQQSNNPDQAWKARARVLFALASAYEKEGRLVDAKEKYDLVLSLPKADSFIVNYAKLHSSRLGFQQIPAKAKKLDNPEIIAILKNLKDVQIRKKLSQEPIHLEAALDYAAIRSSLEANDKQADQTLFLLYRAREEFSAQGDIASKDYHAGMSKYPEKEALYKAYMMLLEANLAKAEAAIALHNGKKREQESKIDLAKTLYKNLLNRNPPTTDYIADQAKLGLSEISKK